MDSACTSPTRCNWDSELHDLCVQLRWRDVKRVAKTLHREEDVDVCVVSTGRFGDVVRKTYLKQTMRSASRPRSCLQEQVAYEATIMKSLSGVDGVLAHLAWSMCSKDWFPGCGRELRSFYFPYIQGDYFPTEPWDIQRYIQQLLQVLDALHRREIVHCNIKRANVLYSHGKVTLIDSGLPRKNLKGVFRF